MLEAAPFGSINAVAEFAIVLGVLEAKISNLAAKFRIDWSFLSNLKLFTVLNNAGTKMEEIKVSPWGLIAKLIGTCSIQAISVFCKIVILSKIYQNLRIK